IYLFVINNDLGFELDREPFFQDPNGVIRLLARSPYSPDPEPLVKGSRSANRFFRIELADGYPQENIRVAQRTDDFAGLWIFQKIFPGLRVHGSDEKARSVFIFSEEFINLFQGIKIIKAIVVREGDNIPPGQGHSRIPGVRKAFRFDLEMFKVEFRSELRRQSIKAPIPILVNDNDFNVRKGEAPQLLVLNGSQKRFQFPDPADGRHDQ